jgi:hypothetical protein
MVVARKKITTIRRVVKQLPVEMLQQCSSGPSSQAADFFATGTPEFIPRYECLNSGGDKVEK